MPIIGFATSCTQRRWQLEQTLPANLEVVRGTRHFLAVVDYGSRDGLGSFLQEFDDDIAAGTLVCFRTASPRQYHSSKAKNTAHRLALTRNPAVLFNLDADNFITPETIALVEETFRDRAEVCLHNRSEVDGDGSSGRIALTADTWQRLGGYDETLLAAAWQDIDLLYRCRALRIPYRSSPRGLRPPVDNDMAQKVLHLELPPGITADTADDLYYTLRHRNLLISLARGPCCLSMDEQQRFEGVLNFRLPMVL